MLLEAESRTHTTIELVEGAIAKILQSHED